MYNQKPLDTQKQLLPIETIIDKVLHPGKYDNVINIPDRFACAEMLLEYWYILSPIHKKAVRGVLVKSGKYE